MRRVLPALTIVLAAWMGIFGTRAASAKISISPAYAEMQLDKGRATGEFSITNDGDDEQRFRVNTQHFIFNRAGSIQKVPPDEHSMAPWIVFNPKEFTLPGKSRQLVRWAVVPRGELRRGEYWCCMELESLNTTVATSTDKEGHKMKIEMVGIVLVPMFGKVGKVTYQGSFKDMRLKAAEDGTTVVEAVVLNEGNGRLFLTGKYEIAGASGDVVAEGKAFYGYVMPGNERDFTTNLKDPLPAGKYTLKMEFTFSGLTDPIKREVSFDWVPPPAKTPKTPATPGPVTPGAAAPPTGAPNSPPASAPASPEPAPPPSAPAAG
jgi:hypothetical protein